MLPQSSADYYRAQQRLVVATLAHTRSEWAKMGSDFDASWANIAPRVELLTASAQLGAARNGTAYVPAVLSELGQSVNPLGLVNPSAFAGVASDGRPLGSLLEGAKIHAKQMNSLDAGGKWLDMAVHTQVQDAARGATSVGMMVRPGVGYVRVVNPPCCGPCAVLAGKHSRPVAFQRHPRCDCFAVPSTDPRSMDLADPTLDQIKGLSAGEHEALKNGADLSRVINSRRVRGLGTTSPDGILSRAKGQDDLMRLLHQHGYITQTGRRVPVTSTQPAIARAASTKVAQATLKPALDLSRIRAAKTPIEVGAELQKILGDRGKVSGFDHPTISTAKAAKVAEQIARLSDKHPRVRFDVVVDEVKDKKEMAHASWRPGKDGEPDYFALVMSRTKMTARSNSEDMLKRSADANHWRVAPGVETDAMTYTVTHEFGHLVDFTTGNYQRAKGARMADDTVSAMRIMRELATSEGLTPPEPYFLWRSPKADPVKVKEFHDYNAFVDKQMSMYARTNSAEGIAEAFADVEINGELASASNKLTVARLLRLLEEMS